MRASLAQLLVAAARHPVLARSVLELAKQLGMGIRTLEKLCKAEGITAKRCLDFIRCLRVVETPQRRWEPRVHVSQYYGDERTIRDLARQGGLDGPVQPGIAHYVDHQKFLESPRLREEIKRELRRT